MEEAVLLGEPTKRSFGKTLLRERRMSSIIHKVPGFLLSQKL
ncbi:hypothetical protein STRDD13_01311 [Streptococcus sp. DD13]|nr:hypothetical protein STRDD13_01311 [Streptococcus sp. DD13]